MRTLVLRFGLAVAMAAALFAAPEASAQSGSQSVARRWNEMLLASIRRDFGRPTVHARNLFHVSVAMWDAWAVFDSRAKPWIVAERHAVADPDAARRVAISHAAYRMLVNRFSSSPGFPVMHPQYVALMGEFGCDASFAATTGDSPAAVGNRIGQTVVAFGLADGSNQANNYANQWYQPVNQPLVVALPGNPAMTDILRYQPLALAHFVDQNGFVIPGGFPPFLSAEWGRVSPFAMGAAERVDRVRSGVTWHVYDDPGPPPELGGEGDEFWRWGHEMVAVWSSHLDPADGVAWDISPGAMGNVTAPTGGDYRPYYRFTSGGDVGAGYPLNPVTGTPYAPQVVRRGDYARVLAEFWADGPDSETPPGHWFKILNYVRDHPLSDRRMGGGGPELDPLEYDVKAYLALGGAMHDTAVSTWSVKGWYDTARPISAIRRMCHLGQSSDPSLPGYHPGGIRLIPGQIELITGATTGPGGRHEELQGYEGLVAIRAWRGPGAISNPATDVAGVGWTLGVMWMPYQRPTFVSPPFGGYTSGHSAYSRAAARVLERLTGSRYFPGGLGEFRATASQYLVFEDGPSTDVVLQFASYYDASDQSSLSRIWGGIHPPFDDIPSRWIGDRTGPRAFDRARRLWATPGCVGDIDADDAVDGSDLGLLLAAWGAAGDGDLDGSGSTDGVDLGLLLAAWGACGP